MRHNPVEFSLTTTSGSAVSTIAEWECKCEESERRVIAKTEKQKQAGLERKQKQAELKRERRKAGNERRKRQTELKREKRERKRISAEKTARERKSFATRAKAIVVAIQASAKEKLETVKASEIVAQNRKEREEIAKRTAERKVNLKEQERHEAKKRAIAESWRIQQEAEARKNQQEYNEFFFSHININSSPPMKQGEEEIRDWDFD